MDRYLDQGHYIIISKNCLAISVTLLGTILGTKNFEVTWWFKKNWSCTSKKRFFHFVAETALLLKLFQFWDRSKWMRIFFKKTGKVFTVS